MRVPLFGVCTSGGLRSLDTYVSRTLTWHHDEWTKPNWSQNKAINKACEEVVISQNSVFYIGLTLFFREKQNPCWQACIKIIKTCCLIFFQRFRIWLALAYLTYDLQILFRLKHFVPAVTIKTCWFFCLQVQIQWRHITVYKLSPTTSDVQLKLNQSNPKRFHVTSSKPCRQRR